MIVVTNDYTRFDQVILDSAIFKKPLSRAAEEFILNNPVIISKTFFHEASTYMLALDSKSCTILKRNIARIIQMITQGGCDIASETEAFDVCQKALELSRRNKRVCVMTENQEMIDRLLSEGTTDVYDLNTDSIANRNMHLRKQVFIDTAKGERVSGIKEGSSLNLGDSRSYTLGKSMDTFGREGRIYEIDRQPGQVAKIYKHYPSPRKCEHLRKLQSIGKQLKADWCLFPQELLYSGSKLVGFTMNKVSVKTLADDHLFFGNNDSIPADRLSLRRSYLINLCLTILAQIKVLNCYGISVPDLNDGNFSWFYENKNITMFDTDSFIEGTYYGNMTDDRCFSRRYSSTNKNQLSLMCEEGALKLVFRVISLGLNAFVSSSQPYIFSASDTAFSFRRSYFAKNLISYLDNVFTAKKEPSISIAIKELCLASREITDVTPAKNLTLKKMIQKAMDNPAPYEVSEIKPRSQPAPKPERVTADSLSAMKCEDLGYNPKKQRKRRKKHVWPWVVSAVVLLLAGAAYYLISNGIILL